MSHSLNETVDKLAAHVAGMASPRVLVCDDVADDLVMVKYALRDINPQIQVDLVTTGEAALESLRRYHYDLFLLDLRLPGMTGLEVVKNMAIKDLHTPVCTLSEMDNGPLVAEALNLGVVFHIRKSHVDEDLKRVFTRPT